MYCSECGTTAQGKFCHSCGTRLLAPSLGSDLLAIASVEDLIPLAEIVETDWTVETNYRDLIEHPEARRRLAVAGQQYQEQITGEEALALFEAIVPTGVPLEKLCRLIVPLYDKMGIRAGKQASRSFDLPPGRVLVGVLCAMASAGQTITQVEQATDGCMLKAKLPSSIWALRGDLVVSVYAHQRQTNVEAATKIPGQLYDWGLSQRVLDQLFQQSSAFAA